MARRARLPRSLGAAGGEPIRHHRALAGTEPGGSAGGERPELCAGRCAFLWTPAPSGAGGDACVGGAFRTPPDLFVRVAGGGDLQGRASVPARESGDPSARLPLSGVHARIRAHGSARRALPNAAGQQAMTGLTATGRPREMVPLPVRALITGAVAIALFEAGFRLAHTGALARELPMVAPVFWPALLAYGRLRAPFAAHPWFA